MNKIVFPAFILMVLIQLYVPVKMIINKEAVISEGKEFKFKTAPIDPHDPFRGKYITLSFEENTAQVANADEWSQGENVFVSLMEDQNGFANIASISKTKPVQEENYVMASIGYIMYDTLSRVTVEFPFTRYYMEESKAGEAEEAYNEASRDTNRVTYALVRIKNGQAVIRDVMINGVSIREIAKSQKEDQDQ